MPHASELTFSERLEAVRAQLADLGVEGLIVPRADEHLSEYVPPCAQRLAWLTGFTGSAGMAAVLPGRAAMLTDGRYRLQQATEVDGSLWELRHSVDEPAPAWLAEHAPGARVGYDPRLWSEDALEPFGRAGLVLVPLPRNPVDEAWTDRPAPPAEPVRFHPTQYAGETAAAKRAAIGLVLAEAGQDAAVLTDPASVAWLFNLRGADVSYTPFALAFAVAHADGTADLFVDRARLLSNTEEAGVRFRAPGDLEGALAGLAGQRVRVDHRTAPAWFAQTLRAAGACVQSGDDPVALPKARKNPVEQAGARAAHHRDGVAMCRFLHWLDSVPPGSETEMSAAARLVAFRSENELFAGESFPAISGAGPNGAIIHYRTSPATDRRIGPDEPYLIDSGAQYLDGTTDVTRTVWVGPGVPPDELRDRATRVLSGHLALAATRFPQGTAGVHLDALARRTLWQAGLDFDHGTGHGVGTYLSVHEGPVSISRLARPVPVEPGMILSDEPGFYLPGQYGIRLENLLLVQPSAVTEVKPFMEFETLTLAPFDNRLIDRAGLSRAELDQLDCYHARVLAEIGPGLPPDARAWLEAACKPT